MADDPLLAAHRWLPRVFVLSPQFSPISIRDQMLRGRMLAERVIDVGLVDERPLLVVGAGAGGATAALHAAARDVRTHLVDRAPAPFGLQLGVSSRLLDPTQYDWPLDHWEKKSFPGRARPCPWISRRKAPASSRWSGPPSSRMLRPREIPSRSTKAQR